jgi:hypothetical protein
MSLRERPAIGGSRAHRGLGAILVLAGFLASGCGDDAAAGSTPPPAPTTTRLVVTLGLQGNLEPCGCGGNNSGGLGALEVVVASQREIGSRSGLEVHAVEGGASFGTGPLTALARDALLTSWQSQGYDACCLGHDELGALPAAWQSAPPAGFLVLGHPTTAGSVATRTLGATLVTSIVADDQAPADAIAYLRRFVANGRARALLPVVMLHANGKARIQLLRTLSGIDAPFVAFDVLWDGSTGGVARYGGGTVVRLTRNGKAIALVDASRDSSIEPTVEVVTLQPTEAGTRHSLRDAVAAVTVATAAPFAGHVGSSRCGACHPSQYARWASTRHATAMQTLEHAEAHTRADCYVCHVTATMPPANAATIALPASIPEPFRAVGCESCHGPGAAHVDERRPLPWQPRTSCAHCHVAKFSGRFSAERALARATCQGAPMTRAERDADPDVSWPQDRAARESAPGK